MQSFIHKRGGNFLFMRIDGYKTAGGKAWFHTPRFRALVKGKEPGEINKVLEPPNNWVAIDLPNDVVIDIDWKDNFEPSIGQKKWWDFFHEKFPYYISATKKRWGRHFIVPREKFINLPTHGNPRLTQLSTDRHQVEVLLDLPTIVSRETFLHFKIQADKPCPEIDYLSLTNAKRDRIPDVKEGYRCIAGGSALPRTVSWADECKVNPELRKYLGMLSDERCDDRETWFQVGCVCKSLHDKTAFYDWSKQSAKFDPEEQDKMWNSLKDDSNFTMGTIIHYAKQDSPEEYKAYVFTYERAKEQLEAKGIAFNNRTAKLIRDGVEISQVDAKAFLAPIQYYFKPKDEMRQVYPKWVCDPQRKTYSDVVFEPFNPKQGDQTKDTQYNLFDKMDFEYVEGTTEDDLSFVKQLIAANCIDENARPWILDYLCDIIQNPASKPKTGVVFKGHAQGSGKGTLVELIQIIIGGKLVHTTNHLDEYFGNFNSGLNGKLLCVCEEVSASDGVKYKEAIKTCLTDCINTINLKNKQPVKQASHNRWIFNSNQYTAVLDDRRYLQAQTDPAKIIPQRTFDDFHTIWKKDKEWINRVGSAMLDHRITHILTRVPKVATDAVRQDGLVQPIHMVLKMLHEGKLPLLDGQHITTTDLKQHHYEACCAMNLPSSYKQKHLTHMKNWLYQEYGHAIRKQRRRLNGVRDYWVTINMPMVVDMMKRNNRFPSDEMYEECYGGNQEVEPC